MTNFKKARRRRSSVSLMMAGAATISIDQSLRPRRMLSTTEALRRDWDAVNRDRRRALAQLSCDLECI